MIWRIALATVQEQPIDVFYSCGEMKHQAGASLYDAKSNVSIDYLRNAICMENLTKGGLCTPTKHL